MEKITFNSRLTISFLIVWLLPFMAFAQYRDHRNRQVDSLEQVLATCTLTGVDLARVYQDLMWGYMEINTEKSMDYAHKCVAVAISLNNWNITANGYKALGRNFYKFAQYDSTLFYYQKGLEVTERMRNFPKSYDEKNIDREISTISGNIGNVYNMQGMEYEAIGYYQKALKIFEKYDWKEHQTLAYLNIGEMYRGMDNYVQAEINYIKMDSLAHITGDSLFIAYAKHFLSALHLRTKNYDKALQNAEEAYAYFFSHPEEGEWKAIILSLLSGIYLEGYGDDRQAEEYAQQALQLYDEMDLPGDIALGYLSQIYLKRKQWRKAEETALKALSIDDSEPFSTLTQYKVLAKAYAYLGNAAKADEYIDKLIELQSLRSNKNYQSSIREMEVKYETEKKELKISNLEKEKQLILVIGIIAVVLFLSIAVSLLVQYRYMRSKKRLAEQQQQLAEQQVKQLQQEKQLVATQAVLDGEVQERSRLARDLHDGLGSILAAAKFNLADIKKSAIQEVVDVERFDKAVELLDESMREMRRVAHHLMPDSLSIFGLKQSIADFCSSVSHVKFTYYGDEARLDPKLEVMIYRIMHELVSNALKHSKAAHILVEIVRYDDKIALTVQDDGCGFDLSAESKGMGLTNIRTRVAAYNGRLLVDSAVGVGTEINVELKFES